MHDTYCGVEVPDADDQKVNDRLATKSFPQTRNHSPDCMDSPFEALGP